jgi:hypothetical protein
LASVNSGLAQFDNSQVFIVLSLSNFAISSPLSHSHPVQLQDMATIKALLHKKNFFGQSPPDYLPLPVDENDAKLSDLETSEVDLESRDSLENSLDRDHQGLDESEGSSGSTSIFVDRAEDRRSSYFNRGLSYPVLMIIILLIYFIFTLIGLSISESVMSYFLAFIVFFSVGLLIFTQRILRHTCPEIFKETSLRGPALLLYYQFTGFECTVISLSIVFLLGRLTNEGVTAFILMLLGFLGPAGFISELLFIASLT